MSEKPDPKVFVKGEVVAFVNANHKLIRHATVVREYRDEQCNHRVEVLYVGSDGKSLFGCHPHHCRVAAEELGTSEIEHAIVRQALRDALAQGYRVNVNNGGSACELPEPSDSYEEVDAALFAAGEDRLYFFRDKERIGWALFLYGNGCDVLSDHADRPEVEAILAGATALAEHYAQA